MRRWVFWLHLGAGLAVCVVVAIMSVTGVLLTYERQVVAWSERHYRAPPGDGAARLPVARLVAAAGAARSGQVPTVITVRRDAAAPAAVTFGREATVFVNPYTGEVHGMGAVGVRGFFRHVTDWHRWLARAGSQRVAGRAVTGASNLAFLFIVLSGVYLWVPRSWTWKQFAQVLWFRRGLSPRARDFNWHNVVGIWTVLPLAVVVASAVPISYPWASDLVYRLAGDVPPVRQAAGEQGGRAQGRVERAGVSASDGAGLRAPDLGVVLDQAAAASPGWQSLAVRLPGPRDRTVVVTADRGDGGQPQLREQLTLDRESGRVLALEPFASQGAGRRARALLRFAHTGEVLGIAGQTVAGAATLGSLFLIYTGAALSWRRWWQHRAAARRDRAA